MSNINEIIKNTKAASYGREFWNAMRLSKAESIVLNEGTAPGVHAFFLPGDDGEELRNTVTAHSAVRPLATVHKHYQGSVDILSASNDDYAAFVPEGHLIPGFDMMDDFSRIRTELFKLATLVKLPTEFVYDASFDIRGYLVKRLAKNFANAEDEAFINGTGADEPTGLLHDTDGAETAATVDSLTYDSIIDLFFSVDPEYRKNAVWMMNDATALVLRKLKDADGNYLWNQASESILGKPVIISNDMPDAESGRKPVLFGDLSYYWIIDRSPASVKALNELFAANDQVGYVGYEYLDAKLIRPDAVKVIAIA